MSDVNRSAENDSPDEGRMEDEALDWLIKQDGGLTPEEQDSFFEWLARDARHGEWFAQHQRTYKQFDSMVQWRPEHSDEPNPDLLATHWLKRPWFWSLGPVAAALVMIGLFVSQPKESDVFFNGFLPEKGVMALEYQIHRLQDGSIVELNKGAQIAIHFNGEERQIDLLSGEAYFEVAKNPERPFIVSARGINVKAIGTAFNVRLEGDSLEVLVTHGRVVMDSSALVEASDLAGTAEPVIINPELQAGQRSLVSFITEVVLPEVDVISEEEVSEELAWKHQVLEFVARPLGEIVAEFNHYNTRQISILDQELLDMEITATFRSYNLDGFVRLLELTGPIKSIIESDESIILTRAERMD